MTRQILGQPAEAAEPGLVEVEVLVLEDIEGEGPLRGTCQET